MSNKKTLKKNFNNNGACLYRNFLSTKEKKRNLQNTFKNHFKIFE